jgi:orotidine-5'-phosphate decarboxylase
MRPVLDLQRSVVANHPSTQMERTVSPGSPEPRDRLIVALDVATRGEALDLVHQLRGVVSFYKVGYQLFLAEGMGIVDTLIAQDLKVFLDLKMDDVGETITLAVREIAKRKVRFLTVHGNGATATASIAGRDGADYPKILQVTLLSSLDKQDLTDLGLLGMMKRFHSVDEYAIWRAEQSVAAGCDGVIASGTTISKIRAKIGADHLIVSPGIRRAGKDSQDHKRVTTPKEAIEAGADYLVVGRPVRDAGEPAAAAQAIIDEIETGLSSLAISSK